jgi:ADP-ribosylglycohydrolase
VDLLLDLTDELLHGTGLHDAVRTRVERQDSPFVSFPLVRWLEEDDLRVIGTRLSPACYLQDSLPAVLYLALKYHDDPRSGLIANTMAGGDNAYRGAVLGALLGLENGLEAWPEEWVKGLR